MLIKIAFFDKYCDEETLLDTTKLNLNVVSKEPIFSSQIRLRKSKGEVYTYNTERYLSNVTEFCYGMLYTIELSEDEMECLDFVLSAIDYKKDNIIVNTIDTNYSCFLKNKFIITSKSVNCLCYTTNLNDIYLKYYRNRHSRVNFHKSLLINII